MANTSVSEIWKYIYGGNADMMSKKWSLENFE